MEELEPGLLGEVGVHPRVADVHEAVALARKAAALNPKSSHPRVTLVNVYLAAGLTLNAKRELETAAQISPQDATIQGLLKRVAKGGA